MFFISLVFYYSFYIWFTYTFIQIISPFFSVPGAVSIYSILFYLRYIFLWLLVSLMNRLWDCVLKVFSFQWPFFSLAHTECLIDSGLAPEFKLQWDSSMQNNEQNWMEQLAEIWNIRRQRLQTAYFNRHFEIFFMILKGMTCSSKLYSLISWCSRRKRDTG